MPANNLAVLADNWRGANESNALNRSSAARAACNMSFVKLKPAWAIANRAVCGWIQQKQKNKSKNGTIKNSSHNEQHTCKSVVLQPG